jgi:hypothetical protein
MRTVAGISKVKTSYLRMVHQRFVRTLTQPQSSHLEIPAVSDLQTHVIQLFNIWLCVSETQTPEISLVFHLNNDAIRFLRGGFFVFTLEWSIQMQQNSWASRFYSLFISPFD